MPTPDPYSKYIDNQVMTATPGKLLIMTYDAGIRFCRIAKQKVEAKDLYEKGRNITRAQNILLSLMSSLNPKFDEQLASNLDALYKYMFERLFQANLHNDTAILDEVIKIMMELREAWVEADLAVCASTGDRELRVA
jgi:flagellar protein FliS